MNSIQASPDYPIKEPDRRLNLKEFSEISTSGHTGMPTGEGTEVICMAKSKCNIKKGASCSWTSISSSMHGQLDLVNSNIATFVIITTTDPLWAFRLALLDMRDDDKDNDDDNNDAYYLYGDVFSF